jgi:cytochrome d ubiquinol oxidase subunit II
MDADLIPLWAGIMAFGVFMYVLLDGFDLGIGILSLFAPNDESRNLMMNSVAPIWDGNETWLVLGGLVMLAVCPLAFAVIMPAVYFPILFMLIGLIFRGVAFEFRQMSPTSHVWDRSFFYGSLIATFAQGLVLGTYIQGIPVEGRQYVGGSFAWATPFALLTGIGLIAGYGLIGACWLILKTEAELQSWARKKATMLAFGVALFIAMVSVWTPFLQPKIFTRWFSWPDTLLLAPIPVITVSLFVWLLRSIKSGREFAPFIAALGLFGMCYLGLGISILPMIVPYQITIWAAAASHKTQSFLIAGTLFLLPIILSYTAWSYWVFRGKVKAGSGYH